MTFKLSWIWKPYLAILLLFLAKKIYFLVNPDTQAFYYYFFLRAFDPHFYLVYTTHVMQVLLNVIHWVPVFLYAHHIRFLSADFWKGLFVLRCLFEVTGHSFEMNALRSVYYQNPKIFWTILAFVTIPYIPSYLACYWYAFRQEKIFNKVRRGK